METKKQITPEELQEIARSYKILVNGNRNSEAVLLLAQTFGTNEDVAKAQEILIHGKSGFKGGDPKLEERRLLHAKLFVLLEQMLQKNQKDLDDIKLGVDPETGGNTVGVWLPEDYTEIGKPVHDWLKANLGDKYLL